MIRIINRRKGMRSYELLKRIRRGCWIDLVAPSEEEVIEVARKLEIPEHELFACLDENEMPRCELTKNYALLIVRVPIKIRGVIKTTPLAIFSKPGYFLTIALRDVSPVLDFLEGKVKNFYTDRRIRLCLQLLSRVINAFTVLTREIGDKMEKVEAKLFAQPSEATILELWKLRRAITRLYSATIANARVLESVLRGKLFRLYKSDEAFLHDLIIDNNELVKTLELYTNLLASTSDAYVSIVSNRLNVVMKKLTALALILSFPVLISSLYGMNVRLPLQTNPNAFFIILALSLLLTFPFIFAFKKLGWL